jgi:hypothetical protein
MHESCICEHGEPCCHEAFVFSVGQTANKSVEMSVFQCDGRLSTLTIGNFSSWRNSVDATRRRPGQKVEGFHKTVMIDRIIRHGHVLTIECSGITYSFFGNDVRIAVDDVCRVAAPKWFGEQWGEKYRCMYLRYFKKAGSANS